MSHKYAKFIRGNFKHEYFKSMQHIGKSERAINILIIKDSII